MGLGGGGGRGGGGSDDGGYRNEEGSGEEVGGEGPKEKVEVKEVVVKVLLEEGAELVE